MKHDPFVRVDKSKVFAPLVARYLAVADELSAQGLDFYVTNDGGYRTYDEQNALYLKGRKTPGPGAKPMKPLGYPVTWARGGQSWHNFGLGLDLVLDTDRTKAGIQPSWQIEKYEPLARVAVKHGLVSGFYWPDPRQEGPHVNLDAESRGVTLALLDSVWKRYRTLDAVWSEVNKRGPW